MIPCCRFQVRAANVGLTNVLSLAILMHTFVMLSQQLYMSA